MLWLGSYNYSAKKMKISNLVVATAVAYPSYSNPGLPGYVQGKLSSVSEYDN